MYICENISAINMIPRNMHSWTASAMSISGDRNNYTKNDSKARKERFETELYIIYQRCYDFFLWCFGILQTIIFFPSSAVKVLGYFGSYQKFLSPLISAPLFNGVCKTDARLDGKTAIVTGCTSGIGKETALEFYKRGARVVMCCLTTAEAESTITDIEQKCIGLTGLGKLVYYILDLGSLDSVRQCCEEIVANEASVHILVNNAGIMMYPQGKTVDGFETHFGVNYLGHFLFTLTLLPIVVRSKTARIINITSSVHFFGAINFNDLHYDNTEYCCFKAYAQSKLAVILFSKELARRLQANNIEEVVVHAVHPGVLRCKIGPHLDQLLVKGANVMWYMVGCVTMKSPKSGAQTTLHCALDESCAKESGLYYCDCTPQTPSEEARDPEVASKLWDVSCQMVGLDVNQKNQLSPCSKLL